MKNPKITVIIVCFNGIKYIENCLAAVLASHYPDFEIIVLDDASTDGSTEILKRYARQNKIQYIQNDQNLGASASRNRAVSASHGSTVLFLDIDTIIHKDALKNIITFFAENPSCALIQGKLIKNTDQLDSVGHYMSAVGFPYEIGRDEDPKKYSQAFKILGAKSAGMAVKKDIFERVGGFDPDYIIYGEDTDLSWRFLLTGHTNFFVPTVEIVHLLKSSQSAQTINRVYYEGSKNTINYLIKNSDLMLLLWIVPIHIGSWIFLSLIKLLKGKYEEAKSIWTGIFWNIINVDKTIQKRRSIRAYAKIQTVPAKIFFGPTGKYELFKKGWRWITGV